MTPPSASPHRGLKDRLSRAAITLAVALGAFASTAFGISALRPKPVIEGMSGGVRAGGLDLAAPGATLTKQIGGLQKRLSTFGDKDWRSWAALGQAYVQQARATADPSYYPKAQGALERSLALNSRDNYQAFTGMSLLAASRHDFATALRWGTRARDINPHNAGTHAVVGDALIELGRYEEAFETFQRMVDLRPGLSSYARVSYSWELRGNTANAIHSMELALQAASSPSDAAFASFHLGELYWNGGRLDKASDYYARGLRLDPTCHRCRAGLAKVKAARGKTREAIRDYVAVTDAFPLPEYVIALGDLYRTTGDTARSSQQYDLVGLQHRLARQNGANVNVEIAEFSADHRIRLSEGLAAARAEWAKRQSVDVADALAWQLYANDRPREALTFAKQAVRLGTRNALFLFHKGMIEKALGMRDAARRDVGAALAINPHFSVLWSKTAVDAYRALGGR